MPSDGTRGQTDLPQSDPSAGDPGGVGRDRALLAVLCALALGYFLLGAFDGLELRDEGHLYAMSRRVVAGEMPHRDFVDIYGPAVFWATGALIALGKGQIAFVRIALALLKVVAVGASFSIARRYTTRPLAIFAALYATAFWGQPYWLFNAPYASLYSLPIALLALACLLRGMARDARAPIVAAGLLAGLAVLFKQSIGAMTIYGLGLGLLAHELLHGGPRDAGRPAPVARRPATAIWLAAGALVLVPFAGIMDLRDYMLHLLPLHAFVGLIAWRAWNGRGVDPREGLSRRLLPFALGAAVPVVGTLVLYLHWGALGTLLYDMFVFPPKVPNYYSRLLLPAAGDLYSIAAGLAGATALLWALGSRLDRAAVAAGVACVLGALAFSLMGGPRGIDPFQVAGAVLPILLTAGLLFFGRDLLQGEDPPRRVERRERAEPWPLIFFSFALVAQVFPAAYFNVMFVQPLVAPLLAVVLAEWVRRTAGRRRDPVHRAWPIAVAVALPILLASPVVAKRVRPLLEARPKEPLHFEYTRGLTVDARQYAQRGFTDLEALVDFLAAPERRGRPLFVLSNRAMIYYLCGRPHLFADRQYYLSLAGWHFLPEEELAGLDVSEMTLRLAHTPDAQIVVHPPLGDDDTPAELRRALPALWHAISAGYRPVARFGPYSVLERAARPGTTPPAG